MNERITTQEHAEAIARGIELLPGRLPERLQHVAFFTADPVHAGLHSQIGHDILAGRKGRTLRNTSHHCDGWAVERPRSEQRSTVVIPHTYELRGDNLVVVVHELGHALDELTGWEQTPKVTTEYSEKDGWEAFAEAFTAWVLPPRGERAWQACDWWEEEYDRARLKLLGDPETVRLFEALAYD